MIRFTLRDKNRRFEVGTVYRFDWQDLYRALAILKDEVENAELKFLVDTMLSSTRELVHQFLWNVIEEANQDESRTKAKVLACLWVVACYGYMHGLQTEMGTPWPKPALKKRTRKANVPDWRAGLKCQFCHARYVPPKKFKKKEVILRRFGIWMKNHLCTPH